MSLPLYQGSAAQAKSTVLGAPKSANTGLWFSRFYDAFDAQWGVGDEGKRDWIDRTIRLGPSGDSAQLQNLLARQRQLCLALGGVAAQFEADGPFVTGMGLSHPVENGLTFHPTLGMPYLPASSVKGLLRGWVEGWMEYDEAGKSDLISRWFGASKGNGDDSFEGAGNLIFFDTLPTKPVHLACDVMTPHMGKWYEGGADINPHNFPTTAPADWHSPVPVPFLVVKSATVFEFMLSPRLIGQTAVDAQTKADLVQATQELKNALEWMGAGAKTATGYGRMIEHQQQSTSTGIKSEVVRWDRAQVSWNKGRATLEVVSSTGKKTWETGASGRAKYDSLSNIARKRLDQGKPVFVMATVSCTGNQTTLLTIEEMA